MPYVDLDIRSGDDHVDSLIRRVIEPYLIEAHFLLAATRPSDGPDGHFPLSCALMLLATVAATSALPNYQRYGQIRKHDKRHFTECLESYFPWEHVRVDDSEHRPDNELVKHTSEVLYANIRCPLFHSGGLVGGLDPALALVKTHPGHTELGRAEQRIEQLARYVTLNGQVFFKFEYRRNILYIDTFYWCVRKMVENFAADADNVKRIREHSTKRT
jgi:hypothetical protein